MKIFIDSTWFIIYEWKGGRCAGILLKYTGPYNAPEFQKLVDAILSPSQQKTYNGGESDKVYSLSKRRQTIMMEKIEQLKQSK